MRLSGLMIAVALAGPAFVATTAATEPNAARGEFEARPLPFVADDYAGALADARARELPLFVEAWAPW